MINQSLSLLVRVAVVMGALYSLLPISLCFAEVTKEREPPLPEEQGWDDYIIDRKMILSKYIDASAKKIDLLLAKKRYVDVPNDTKIIIFNNVTWEEGGKLSYAPHLGLRLHLPNLQKKLALNFTTYDEDELNRGINTSRSRVSSRERNPGTSLSLFEDLGKVRVEFRPRVEYRSGWISSYLFTFSSNMERGILRFKPQLQLFARSDTGVGQFVGTNLDIQVTSSNLLTLVNEEEYTDSNNTLATNHGFKFDHSYNNRLSQDYVFLIESNNRSRYHLERSILSTSFKHKLYVESLHYAFTPSLSFAKAVHFHPRTALNLRVDLIF